jgi:microcystin-dependent protein
MNTHVRDNMLAVTPAGAILGYGNTTAPSGWLACDGTAVSRTTYAALFAAISTGYGVGDGSTTFNVPDFRGRVISGLGTHVDVNALANNEAAALADRSPSHHHTLVMYPDVANGNQLKEGSGVAGGTKKTSGNANLADKPAYGVALYIIKT